MSITDGVGNITGWQEDAALPTVICCGSMSVANGYAYLIGGYSPVGYLDSVFFTNIMDTPPPTPTPTIAPTPTPAVVNKVVIVPGMFGSWNSDTLLNCKLNDYTGEWGPIPVFWDKVYGLLTKVLNINGYSVYPFYYDWRHQVAESGDKLDLFIKSIIKPGEKIYLVGHSMGGLVARAYIEKHSNEAVEKFMSVGAPHQGLSVAYYSWSGGDVSNDDLLYRTAQTTVLKLCGGYNSDREIIQNEFPSVQNMLPIYDYLLDNKADKLTPVGEMAARNNWLPTKLMPKFWGVRLGTISGDGVQTIESIKIKDQTLKDILLGDWKDGVPTGRVFTKMGDGSVLLSSSQLEGADNYVLKKNHIEIENSGEAVSQIVKFLTENPVSVQSQDTPVNSALLVLGGAAQTSVVSPENEETNSANGLIVIINPVKGKYRLKISSVDQEAKISVAQFHVNGKVVWKDYNYTGPLTKEEVFSYDENSGEI